MYIYSLTGFEERSIILHEKKFTTKKFQNMCKEAPTHESCVGNYYDAQLILKYLVKTYGFTKVKYTAGFFIDTETVEPKPISKK